MTNASSLVLLLALLGGCGALDNCPDGQAEPILITDRPGDPEEKTWESVGWSGTLDAFPAKTAVAFEHGLGFTPLDVVPYLSFSPDGTNGADGGSVAPSAGNQSLIDCVDSNVIIVKNDTCEKNFYIRVTASGVALKDLKDECTKRPE